MIWFNEHKIYIALQQSDISYINIKQDLYKVNFD